MNELAHEIRGLPEPDKTINLRKDTMKDSYYQLDHDSSPAPNNPFCGEDNVNTRKMTPVFF